MLIVSEAQAHRVGMARTGSRDAYRVRWYIQPQTRLTLFCVEISKTRETITHQ